MVTDFRRKKQAVQEGYIGELTAKKHHNRTQHQRRTTNYKKDKNNNKELKPNIKQQKSRPASIVSCTQGSRKCDRSKEYVSCTFWLVKKVFTAI